MEINFRSVGIILVLLGVLIVKESVAIKCWECQSGADGKCSDPFDNTTFPIGDCSKKEKSFEGLNSTMCRKVRQKVNGVWNYYRGCAVLGEPGIGGDERYCLMRTGTYNIFMEYCTCNSKDGCNSASLLSFSPILLIVPVLRLLFR